MPTSIRVVTKFHQDADSDTIPNIHESFIVSIDWFLEKKKKNKRCTLFQNNDYTTGNLKFVQKKYMFYAKNCAISGKPLCTWNKEECENLVDNGDLQEGWLPYYVFEDRKNKIAEVHPISSKQKKQGKKTKSKQNQIEHGVANIKKMSIFTLVPWTIVPLPLTKEEIQSILDYPKNQEIKTKNNFWKKIFNEDHGISDDDIDNERQMSVDMIRFSETSTPQSLKKLQQFMEKVGKHFNPAWIVTDLCFLRSLPNCPAQLPHLDGNIYSRDMEMASAVIALQPNTSLLVNDLPGQTRTLPIPQNSMVIFDNDLVHAGAANDSESENIRMHCYFVPKHLKNNDFAQFVRKPNLVCEYCNKVFREVKRLNYHQKGRCKEAKKQKKEIEDKEKDIVEETVEEKRTSEEAEGDPNVGNKRTFQMLFGENDSDSDV